MKEQRFEKLVEWDLSEENCEGFFLFCILTGLLIVSLCVAYFARDFNMILGIAILYTCFFVIGIIVFIRSYRKVYWSSLGNETK